MGYRMSSRNTTSGLVEITGDILPFNDKSRITTELLYFDLSSKLQRRHYGRTVHIKFEFYYFHEILF